MSQLFVLFEHAACYALFRVKQFEEIGMLLPQVEKSVLELNKFQSVVKFHACLPFKNANNALDNINSVSEGIVHEDLQLFLETNLPKPGKKESIILGVGDAKIGGAICEIFNVKCQQTGAIPEIIRGIRYHFHNLVRGFTDVSSAKAQLGLGHSYSRAKVKHNVNRVDNMIIQSISLLEQLDKDINTFAMRIREWYSYHFPELITIVPDNYTYAKLALLIGNRDLLNKDRLPELEELVMDSAKAEAIVYAARTSMGMEISPIDLINIEQFAKRVVSLADYRRSLHEYLKKRMSSVAPNLATLIGEIVGAKLISHAGSLTNLAKYPASTVQILGAEKALFRALKTRGNTPKYGLIFHSTFIGRAGAKNKGRISRYLANKCSIASRIDCFSDIPTTVFGEKLREQVEERLKYFDSGEVPRKNIDVMQDAIQEAQKVQLKVMKKQKKKRKSEAAANEVMEEDAVEEDQSLSPVKKKKKKKQENGVEMEISTKRKLIDNGDGEDGTSAKKKKKKNRAVEDDFNNDNTFEEEAEPKKKKKKSKV